MNKLKFASLILCLIVSLCSCMNQNEDSTMISSNIVVNNNSFSIEEIENGIVETFNNLLYYNGNNDDSAYLTMNKNLVLGKEIEYDLYYNNKGVADFYSKIWIVFTNVEYPYSPDTSRQLYVFAINITELGLQSNFSFMGYMTANKDYDFMNADTINLGKHSLLLGEISIPLHEKMSVEWQQQVKTAICLYMDENDFYVNEDKNLSAGKYKVYVQGFFKSDENTKIIFENENGNIYIGDYNFIREITDNYSANLNHVELYNDCDEPNFKTYLERVRLNAVISFEYEVSRKTEKERHGTVLLG